MVKHNKVNVKLSDSQQNKLKFAVTGVNLKMFGGNNLSYVWIIIENKAKV